MSVDVAGDVARVGLLLVAASGTIAPFKFHY